MACSRAASLWVSSATRNTPFSTTCVSCKRWAQSKKRNLFQREGTHRMSPLDHFLTIVDGRIETATCQIDSSAFLVNAELCFRTGGKREPGCKFEGVRVVFLGLRVCVHALCIGARENEKLDRFHPVAAPLEMHGQLRCNP